MTHYPELPQVAVGGIVLQDNQVLLVLRANAPAKNQWAIPGGRVKLGETLQHAVEREIFEETGLSVKAGEVVYVFDTISRDECERVEFHYVIIDLLAQVVDSSQSLIPGDDARDAQWFTLDHLMQPGFPVSHETLTLLKRLMKE